MNFIHDNFANDKAYLNRLIDNFTSQNAPFEWACAVRPDNVDRELLARMKKAGCFLVFCGADSGSSSVLRRMRKMADSRRCYSFFQACREARVGFETNTIIGNPDETPDDLEDSLALLFDCVAHGGTSADLSVLQPLPGALVTEAYRGALVPEDNVQLGGFLPSEARELARKDLETFTGFGFIRKGNREFEYYADFVRIARFFTRHFFRTVYFLKRHCGVEYTEIFEWMRAERDPVLFPRRLTRFISAGARSGNWRVARSVHAYDSAVESIKGTELPGELQNTYLEPTRRSDRVRYKLLELPYEVHSLFGRLPDLPDRGPEKRTVYLLCAQEGGVAAIQLSVWQARFWKAADSGTSLSRLRQSWIRRLTARGVSRKRANESVGNFASFVEQILMA